MDTVLIIQSTVFIIVLLYGHIWKSGDIMQNKRTARTRQQFIDAFFDLAEIMPTTKINVKMLCEKADLNRSTFYLHYETIDSLIDDIEQRWITEHVQILGKVDRNDNTRPFIMQVLAMIRKRPNLYLHIMEDYRFTDRYVEKMQEHFYSTVEIPDSVRPDYFYEYVLNGSLAMTRKWIRSGCEMSDEQFAQLSFVLNHGTTYGIGINDQ